MPRPCVVGDSSPFLKRVLIPFWVIRIVIMAIQIALYATLIAGLGVFSDDLERLYDEYLQHQPRVRRRSRRRMCHHCHHPALSDPRHCLHRQARQTHLVPAVLPGRQHYPGPLLYCQLCSHNGRSPQGRGGHRYQRVHPPLLPGPTLLRLGRLPPVPHGFPGRHLHTDRQPGDAQPRRQQHELPPDRGPSRPAAVRVRAEGVPQVDGNLLRPGVRRPGPAVRAAGLCSSKRRVRAFQAGRQQDRRAGPAAGK